MASLAQSRCGPLVWVILSVVSLCLGGHWHLTLAEAAQNSHGNQPKQVQFEVLSIRPASGPRGSTAPSPNGFDSALSLWQAIMVAYGPENPVQWGSVEILKAPGWIGDFYEMHGRVAQVDLKAWQNQGRGIELLRSAMRAALKDRCKLAIHEQPAKAETFQLAVGKRGPRLKTATPNSTLPTGVKVKSGGVMASSQGNGHQVWTFHRATMQDLVNFLNIMSGSIPVRDRTGLTGRYDFAIRQADLLSPDENHVYSYPIDHLGLQVKWGSENRPRLVIDHIERPTPN